MSSIRINTKELIKYINECTREAYNKPKNHDFMEDVKARELDECLNKIIPCFRTEEGRKKAILEAVEIGTRDHEHIDEAIEHYLDIGEAEKVIGLIQRYKIEKPYWDVLHEVYAAAGEYLKAIEVLPDDPGVYRKKMKCLEKAGEHKKAADLTFRMHRYSRRFNGVDFKDVANDLLEICEKEGDFAQAARIAALNQDIELCENYSLLAQKIGQVENEGEFKRELYHLIGL